MWALTITVFIQVLLSWSLGDALHSDYKWRGPGVGGCELKEKRHHSGPTVQFRRERDGDRVRAPAARAPDTALATAERLATAPAVL